jgi:hypothetical protein
MRSYGNPDVFCSYLVLKEPALLVPPSLLHLEARVSLERESRHIKILDLGLFGALEVGELPPPEWDLLPERLQRNQGEEEEEGAGRHFVSIILSTK